LQQPLGLMLVGHDLLAYEEAFHIYEADKKLAPASIRQIVNETAAASVLAKMRGE